MNKEKQYKVNKVMCDVCQREVPETTAKVINKFGMSLLVCSACAEKEEKGNKGVK